MKIRSMETESDTIPLEEVSMYTCDCPCCSKVHYVLFINLKNKELTRHTFNPPIAHSKLTQLLLCWDTQERR